MTGPACSAQNRQSEPPKLTFLKLGGSLITDKARPHTPRLEVIARLAGEVAAACRHSPDLRLLLGHGSGSFGHVPARRYATRQGVSSRADWQGFIEVWREADALNRLVVDALGAAGLPAISFQPSASVTARDGQVSAWDITLLRQALAAGLLPVVYGDVIFDLKRGGTILSTEDLFDYLVSKLRPQRVLLAGLEPGVWADFPECTRLFPQIDSRNWEQIAPALGGSATTDVTGGMASKVRQSRQWVQALPGLQVRIFSGVSAGAVERALNGEAVGTRIDL
jgi:isopentenyl phosphate kinase